MNRFLQLILFFIMMGSLSAQSFVKNSTPIFLNNSKLSNDHVIKILAVMVEFQEDKYDGTTGNGKFGSHYTQVYGDTILDPLPHNVSYFEDHLEFAKNYFNKVSKGKVSVEYKVLPEIITVSKMMRDYVPSYNSNDYTPIGIFAKEVWQLADQKFTNINFSDYDLFIIFHAGISNAFSEGAPLINRNMPSLYFGLPSFQKIFGNQFAGFPVKGNSYQIKNTIIMPETESREISAIDGSKILIELSINGLLVSNIATHLGLPDLFNTNTGKSAIGRFGLMDPQAIFANRGMFPPEPSPWEKIILGWESPITFTPGNKKVTISTRNSATQNDTTLLKIPINSSEYFLVENRSQDANNDKVKVTYKRSGQVYTKIIELDTSGVYVIERNNKNGIFGGVVIDVDEYDAALPGNGIVIWHIDEKVIENKIGENKINANPDRKGVDVEEADGIQDIGVDFFTVFGEVLVGEGTKDDFWFKGNKSKLYKNRFSFDSKPNSRLNDGSNSLITLENFSNIANKISFDIFYGTNEINLSRSLKIQEIKNPVSLSTLQIGSNYWTYILNGFDLLRIDSFNGIETTVKNFSSFPPAVFKDGSNEFVIGAMGNTLNIYSTITNSELTSHVLSSEITSIPVVVKSGAIIKGLVGTSDGKVLAIDLIQFLQSNHANGIQTFPFENKPVKQIAAYDDYFSVITENKFFDSKGKSLLLNQKPKRIALTKNVEGKFVNIILSDKNYFNVIVDGQLISSFSLPGDEISSFSLADLFSDGNNYIFFNSKSNIYAINYYGILADNFPIITESNYSLIGTPLIIDINNDSKPEVLSFSSAGTLFAYNCSDGKILSSFPINVIKSKNVIPAITLEELPTMSPIARYKPILPALSDNGELSFWSLSSLSGKEYWLSEYATSSNNSFVSVADTKSKIVDYFPLEKTYNWPNPVYGNETNIRYYVSEDSEVSIKIFDLAGDLVANLSGNAIGGIDNETKWNVADVQSGIYYARIEVKSKTGKSASKLIKIAVIK